MYTNGKYSGRLLGLKGKYILNNVKDTFMEEVKNKYLKKF